MAARLAGLQRRQTDTEKMSLASQWAGPRGRCAGAPLCPEGLRDCDNLLAGRQFKQIPFSGLSIPADCPNGTLTTSSPFQQLVLVSNGPGTQHWSVCRSHARRQGPSQGQTVMGRRSRQPWIGTNRPALRWAHCPLSWQARQATRRVVNITNDTCDNGLPPALQPMGKATAITRVDAVFFRRPVDCQYIATPAS